MDKRSCTWASYKAYKRLKGADFATLLRAWRCYVQFRRQSTILRKEARRRKQCLVVEFLHDASNCALQHDAGRHKKVNKLCPQARTEAIHLILSPEDALEELHTYFQDFFGDPTYKLVPLPAMEAVPFSVPELEHAIQQLPVIKATVESYCQKPSMAFGASSRAHCRRIGTRRSCGSWQSRARRHGLRHHSDP